MCVLDIWELWLHAEKLTVNIRYKKKKKNLEYFFFVSLIIRDIFNAQLNYKYYTN